MGKILTIAAIGLLTLIISGCNTSGCTDNQNSLPLAGFYDYATGQAISLSILDIGGVDAPDDSLLYTAGTAYSEVYLPFRSAQNSTSYFIHYAQAGIDSDEMNDALTFDYTSQPYFASEECGAMYHYSITRMTHTTHIVDSVAITDSLITNKNLQRIKIFFRTMPEPDPEPEPGPEEPERPEEPEA